jgi:hypothetical protein
MRFRLGQSHIEVDFSTHTWIISSMPTISEIRSHYLAGRFRKPKGFLGRVGLDTIGVFGIFAALMSVSANALEVRKDASFALDCPTCKKSISIPFIRIAILETAMLTVSAAVWVDGYSPVCIRRNAAQFKASLTGPPDYRFTPNILETDGDWWYFNLIAHGLFGSEPYLAARDWGHRPVIAFLYTLFASTVWEYLIEGWFKQPSAVDLAWSPAFGSLIGELRYQAARATRRIRNKHLSTALRSIVDPFGEMERAIVQ